METRRVLVDTSILIDYFRKQNKKKSNLWHLLSGSDELCISVISEFEFFCGCRNTRRIDEALKFFNLFMRIDFSSKHSYTASEIYNQLRYNNQLIDVVDILLAGVAISENMFLATLNKNHFQRIKA